MNKIPDSEEKEISSWDRQYQKKVKITYPKNFKELKSIIFYLKKEKNSYIIRTGECSYNSKSMPGNDNTYVISLKNFNKIISVNKKTIEVEAGTLIRDIVKKIKIKKLSLHSIPGGSEISIGGAISANVIGKDSNPTYACFGDAIESLDILKENGSIIRIKKNEKNFYKYIGAFGFSGIILAAKLQVKKLKSQNLRLETHLINNINDLVKELKKKSDYKFVHLDPFFRKDSFGLVIKASQVSINKNYYNFKNLKPNRLEKKIFDFSSYFLNGFILRLIYRIFFFKNKNLNQIVDIHNFHYQNKYTHLVPRLSKQYLCDYEILIKKEYEKKISEIIFFLKKEQIYPIYIVIKKIFKSKKKYFYKFCDDGYSMSLGFDKNMLTERKILLFRKLLNKQSSFLNMAKVDDISFAKKENNLFMSLFKRKIISKSNKTFV